MPRIKFRPFLPSPEYLDKIVAMPWEQRFPDDRRLYSETPLFTFRITPRQSYDSGRPMEASDIITVESRGKFLEPEALQADGIIPSFAEPVTVAQYDVLLRLLETLTAISSDRSKVSINRIIAGAPGYITMGILDPEHYGVRACVAMPPKGLPGSPGKAKWWIASMKEGQTAPTGSLDRFLKVLA